MFKRICNLSLIAMLLCSAVACGDDDKESEITDPVLQPVGVVTDRPTNWSTMTSDTHQLALTSMMLSVSSQAMPADVQTDDMLAAFVAGECRAVASPSIIEDSNELWFLLNVPSLISDENASNLTIELHYYSTAKGMLYRAVPITYEPDAWRGSVAGDTFYPEWVKAPATTK